MTKGNLEAYVVMVGESAAAIMARPGPARPHFKRRAMLAAGALAAIVVVVTVAILCGPHGGSTRTSSSLQVVGLRPGSSAEDTAARAATDAYRGYQAAYAAAGRSANPTDPRLAHFAADAALIEVKLSIRTMAESGWAYRGGFSGTVRVTQVSLATSTVRLLNCQDISGLEVIERSTGNPITTSRQNLRFPVVATAHYLDGRWMIVDIAADRKQRC